MTKKIIAYIILFLLISSATFSIYHYKGDLPPQYLIEKYTYPESKFMQIDELNVHYRKTGNGAALILIHGFGANLRNWDSWHQILSDSFTVISMDLPGYGLTGPRSNGNHSYRSQVDFLEKFVSSMGLNKIYLAGNSMGGGISWMYALKNPEVVEKMILLNSAGYPEQEKTNKKGVLGFKLLKMPVINLIATKITPRFVLKKSVKAVFADQALGTEQEVDTYMDILRRSGNRKVLVERMTTKWEDRSFEIKNITVPTLIIWGKKDEVIDVNDAYKFKRDISRSELIIYEDVGHVPMIEQAVQSAEDVRKFINPYY